MKKIEDALNTTLTREKMLANLTQTKTELNALFSTPAVCAAMTELLKINAGAADCTVARAGSARADAILAAYDASRRPAFRLSPAIATNIRKHPSDADIALQTLERPLDV